MTTTEAPLKRMSAEERRTSIVRAAGTVFGRNGYAGTTTDQVARAAGISQPYVVRMFGSKEALFIEVMDRAERDLLDAFARVLQEQRAAHRPDDELEHALGDAYIALVADQGIHQPLMQGFLEGADPVIGPRSRAGFLHVWRFLTRDAGLTPQRAASFLGDGMLINVLLGLQLPTDPDPEAQALIEAVCGPKAEFVREHAR